MTQIHPRHRQLLLCFHSARRNEVSVSRGSGQSWSPPRMSPPPAAVLLPWPQPPGITQWRGAVRAEAGFRTLYYGATNCPYPFGEAQFKHFLPRALSTILQHWYNEELMQDLCQTFQILWFSLWLITKMQHKQAELSYIHTSLFVCPVLGSFFHLCPPHPSCLDLLCPHLSWCFVSRGTYPSLPSPVLSSIMG